GAEANETIDFSLDASNMASLAGSSEASTADRLSTIDEALSQLTQTQADIGAVSNRLESTASSLSNANQIAQEAYSRVMDTDYAAASAEKARLDLQKQVTIALLSQANAQKDDVLRLLNA
ncbi:MAG: hypothetical protein HWE12_15950, partial [Oceanospirillaceae bacterium]|nr:hypothetical protein [Oceanospirillaceae bacterium]